MTVRVSQPALTRRQSQVLHLIQYGYTDQQIGTQIGVSRNTVKFHSRAMCRRIGARNRAHAVAIGLTTGLIQ